MNPLSPFTYYRRHKGQALLLLILVGSLTLGVHAMVNLLDTAMANGLYHAHYLTRMSRISTSETPSISWQSQSLLPVGTLDSAIVAQIRAHPDVAAVIPENGVYIGIPIGAVVATPMLGVTEADLPLMMEACDLRLRAGRLIRPRAGEIILSEQYARALDLNIGDHISYRANANYYRTVPTELTLVGILESVPSDAGPEVRTGFVSYEYLEAHELYQPRATNWLILPRPGSRVAVNDFVSDLITESAVSASVHLQTFEDTMEGVRTMQRVFDGMYKLVDGLVAVAAALVVGTMHRIAVSHRLPELGLLHATGYRKHSLVRRLVLEIATIACLGWAAGLLSAHVFSVLLSSTFLAARGWTTNLVNLAPFLYTLPIPLVVVAWINVSVSRTLNRLDPVAIIERGKLSAESDRPKQTVKQALSNPRSSLTFLIRHRRRAIFLLTAIGLMVLGVALPGFLNAMLWESVSPCYLSYTSHASIVSPGYAYLAIAPDIVAQIRAHPAVAHAIPAKALSMMVDLPLVGELMSLPIYAVREQDLPILLDVYSLHLREGETVQPRSGQVILSGSLARNRGLGIGSTIGHPVQERDGMPTELTVIGLLESSAPALVERTGYDVPSVPRWVGFASYEYVDGHERYAGTPTYLLVVPVEARESEMEAWLEETIASPRVRIETLATSHRLWREGAQTIQTLLATSMLVLAVVAVLGLTILNTISFTQRRDEFGILHAMGYSRIRLVWRTLRESASVVIAAWMAGAAACIAGLLYLQARVLAPAGLSLNRYDPQPWLYTLPIPIAVVAAGAATIAWALSRLDPVAVIERR